MKKLYESILSSTNTGKIAKVEQWCKEHILPYTYEIKDGKVCSNGQSLLSIEDINEPIPDYVQFGRVDNFIAGVALQYMTKKQVPEYTDSFFVTGFVRELKWATINVGGLFEIHNFHQYLTKIRDFTINIKKYDGPQNTDVKLVFSLTKIKLDDLKNLTITADEDAKKRIICLKIEKTPAEKEILSIIKNTKDKLSDDDEYYKMVCVDKLIRENFSNFPETLQMIKMSKNTLLKDTKDNYWKLY